MSRKMTPSDEKWIRIWYWSGAFLVFFILIIGGITRLTQSGLSMVEWKPIMGMIPPLTDAQWEETFNLYREFPEYQQRNRGKNLSEFQFIFFWEYLHRVAGRLIGLVFLIPFCYFIIRKKFSPLQLKRASLLLLLGLSQGLMGWYMVMSGLVDVPYVSPYRLAAHLLLAFAIFGCCVWFALDLYPGRRFQGIFRKQNLRRGSPSGDGFHGYNLRPWLLAFLVILILQVAWGAFVAGLNAGYVYNTFPKMNQVWIPFQLWIMEPFIQNFVAHPAGVQWVHRLLATLIGGMAIYIWIRVKFSDAAALKRWSLALFLIVGVQYLIGVFTLLNHVPVSLGVLHQAVAMILFGTALVFYHQLKNHANS